MTDAQIFAQLHKLTPADAVAYLQKRGQLAVTYGWQDLWHEEHARQFTISRLTRADLLSSLQEMITKSVDGNLGRRDFERDAQKLLTDAGWWGTKEVIDPATGEILKTRFDAQRLKLIFDTNTRNAYAAGQWERAQRTKFTHPYGRIISKDDGRVRPEHRAWHNITLPLDHVFWLTHWCPNGWKCRCRIVLVSKAEYERGLTPTGAPMKKDAPDIIWRDWLNRRTGEVQRVPAGIDPGFGYNAGRAREAALQRLVQNKLTTLDAPLGAALWQSVQAELAATQLAECQAMVARVSSDKRANGQMLLVHTVDAQTQQALAAQGVRLDNAAVLLRDTEVMHALRDSKVARGAAVPENVLADLPNHLPGAAVYLDTVNNTLVYAMSLPGQVGKVVVRVNYSEKGRLGAERMKITANHVATAGIIQASDLLAARYVRMK
ncbi:SPP1 gp7 family putative phage head morphogenesis protein [Paucibacter oligotrophus]|uniref:SPP1 gp7 family putative phage head morphogenesis protein n=1 Tax=Roseateles oligotrophus TaxID=1769250 RepID=A0A840LFK1_9BURK|nr:phage minor head protein [Roseateles oligotrophus]MBB4844988.1 SPP1 gp7 family putative phage head morphogenesis protein [Roseateles oligotrophus]